jgi:hypothetical protein
MTTVAVQLLIESARTLGTGKTESEELHLIPIIFVCVASKLTIQVAIRDR